MHGTIRPVELHPIPCMESLHYCFTDVFIHGNTCIHQEIIACNHMILCMALHGITCVFRSEKPHEHQDVFELNEHF